MERKKGLSGFALKLVAIITMVIDHIGATIVERSMIARGFNEAAHKGSKSLTEWMNNPISNYMLYDLNNLMRSVGRLAFPLFCFLLVEGFEHTKSKKKYALRMALFCLISEIPFKAASFRISATERSCITCLGGSPKRSIISSRTSE